MRNNSIDHDDERVWQRGEASWSPIASDGLAIAIQFARKIALGESPTDWTILLRLHLTREGNLEGGAFVTTKPKKTIMNFHWVEERIINVSALLPCIFRNGEGDLNELASAEFLHNGQAYDPASIDDDGDADI